MEWVRSEDKVGEMILRVTQGMLTNNSVKYLSQSYNRLSQLSDQMTSGKKISKPSDDPVVAMNGMHIVVKR